VARPLLQQTLLPGRRLQAASSLPATKLPPTDGWRTAGEFTVNVKTLARALLTARQSWLVAGVDHRGCAVPYWMVLFHIDQRSQRLDQRVTQKQRLVMRYQFSSGILSEDVSLKLIAEACLPDNQMETRYD